MVWRVRERPGGRWGELQRGKMEGRKWGLAGSLLQMLQFPIQTIQMENHSKGNFARTRILKYWSKPWEALDPFLQRGNCGTKELASAL